MKECEILKGLEFAIRRFESHDAHRFTMEAIEQERTGRKLQKMQKEALRKYRYTYRDIGLVVE